MCDGDGGGGGDTPSMGRARPGWPEGQPNPTLKGPGSGQIFHGLALHRVTFNQNVCLYIIKEDPHCKILHFNLLFPSPLLIQHSLDQKFCQAKVS